MIAAAGVIGRWGALDDGALAHGVDLDRFSIGVARVLVLLLEHDGFCDGRRQRGQERAGVREGENGDGATHCLEAVAGLLLMCCFYAAVMAVSFRLALMDAARLMYNARISVMGSKGILEGNHATNSA